MVVVKDLNDAEHREIVFPQRHFRRVEKFCESTVFASDRMLETGFQPPCPLREALVGTITQELAGAETKLG